MILAAMGGFSTGSTASLPRSGVPAVEMVFVLVEVLIVATVVVIAMIYDPSRPLRANYLLVAGGLVTMATADRVIAYLRSVDIESGDLWGGIGFIVGPLHGRVRDARAVASGAGIARTAAATLRSWFCPTAGSSGSQCCSRSTC